MEQDHRVAGFSDSLQCCFLLEDIQSQAERAKCQMSLKQIFLRRRLGVFCACDEFLRGMPCLQCSLEQAEAISSLSLGLKSAETVDMPRRVSTVRGRAFGEGVRAVVMGSGLSSREVAKLVECDESKVSEVLNGKVYLSRIEVAVLLSVCRPEPAERDRLLALYPTRHVPGWWQQHGKCGPIRPCTVLDHVAVAEELIDWQPHALPVFLRTDGYARELMIASATVPEEELDERLCVQAEMRNSLRDRLNCTFYIHEFALRLLAGNSAVHAEQMLHLTIMANWKYVKIRVVPASAGVHAGMNGSFTQLKFPKFEPVIWLEALNSSTFVELKESIEGYEAAIGRLDDVSLSEQESLELINQLQSW